MVQQELTTVFSGVFGIGTVQQIYPVKKSNRWGNVIAGIIFLVIAIIVFVIGLWNAYEQWAKYGSAIILKNLVPPIIISGILMLIVLLVFWSAYRNWKKGVAIYQNGMAYSDRKGIQVWRWDEFLSITSAVTKHYTNGIYTGTTHVYTLIKNDNSKVVLNDSIRKVEDAVMAIRSNIYPLLYKKAADTYNSGLPVVFGPVSLSKTNGISIGKKNYPWTEVSQVSIHQGVLRIAKLNGGWFSGASAMASTIPNIEVMLSIVDQVVGVKTK